ncbi:virulence-associated protein E [Roseomonas eburnea]|uniref:Virulence-associated protein E n=1 Tax=Neoroseomonas eburnea TaxID=1346889 RepID=A0A9X9XET4_9PROT|nr:toprim domain-containing protein [Neoroseomonas eburnea]MBR0682220.1 virulence-associated protein E [Neoroseomonas eburnea]
MNATDIAQALHLKRAGRDWRGDCPACGYRGTFSVTTKDGRTLWRCASCQDRGGVTAVVRGVIGGNWTPPAPPLASGPDNAGRTRAALALWDEAVPLPGTLAAMYLAARGLPGEASTALRYHPALRHPHETASFPCLVALVVSTETGEPVAIHRTYLRRDGSGKAAVEPAKASKGPTAGGAIMLSAPMPGAPLVIGEGIESSLSAGRLMSAPAWAAIAAGNLSRIMPPAAPSEIVIAADADEAGQREAWTAARIWQAQGRRVRVATPDNPGEDFNDLWRARMAREAPNG